MKRWQLCIYLVRVMERSGPFDGYILAKLYGKEHAGYGGS